VLLARKFIHHHVAEGHNDVLVPLFLTAGVIYAVLLGFMVVAVWESYDAARNNTNEEAVLLITLFRQSEVMAEEKGEEMRSLLRDYAEEVASGWHDFQGGVPSAAARKTLGKILYVYSTLTPATKPREFVAAQFLQTLSQVISDRNKRIQQSHEALSWVMWLGAIGGGVVTVAMSFILYMDRGWPHVLMASVMSALIGMLLFMMMVLSRPFVGPLAIQPEQFEAALKTFEAIDKDAQEIKDAHH
jgi:hypothetical protein